LCPSGSRRRRRRPHGTVSAREDFWLSRLIRRLTCWRNKARLPGLWYSGRADRGQGQTGPRVAFPGRCGIVPHADWRPKQPHAMVALLLTLPRGSGRSLTGTCRYKDHSASLTPKSSGPTMCCFRKEMRGHPAGGLG
jgi:hypothetical protein